MVEIKRLIMIGRKKRGLVRADPGPKDKYRKGSNRCFLIKSKWCEINSFNRVGLIDNRRRLK